MTAAAFGPGTTVAAVRRGLAVDLRKQGFETPDLDARVLVGDALSLDHAALIRDAERMLNADELATVAAIAARRLAGEPVARIVGVKEFWSLPFRVTAATLVPRPETETVVEAALAAVDANGGRQQSVRLADIGTGSGALLLALLSELPKATGIATDISPAALEIARHNAERLGLTDRAQFVACDFAAALCGPFDLIVSNPPYVAHDEIATLAPGVRDYEPHLALDGGPDGLGAYRALALHAPQMLATTGSLVVELGAGQSGAVGEIFEACGLAMTALHPDLNRIPRVITAVCSPPDGNRAGKKPLGLSRKTD